MMKEQTICNRKNWHWPDCGQDCLLVGGFRKGWRTKGWWVRDSSFDKEEEEARAGWMVSHPWFPVFAFVRTKKKKIAISVTRSHVRFFREFLHPSWTTLVFKLDCIVKKKRFRNVSVRIFVEERFLMYHFLVSILL